MQAQAIGFRLNQFVAPLPAARASGRGLAQMEGGRSMGSERLNSQCQRPFERSCFMLSEEHNHCSHVFNFYSRPIHA